MAAFSHRPARWLSAPEPAAEPPATPQAVRRPSLGLSLLSPEEIRTSPDAGRRALRRLSMVSGRVSRPAARRIMMQPYNPQALVAAARIADMHREAEAARLAREVKRARRRAGQGLAPVRPPR